MRKLTSILTAVFLMIFTLGSCASKNENAFTVKVLCQSREIYRIFWTCYLDGERCGSGGMADLEGNEITEQTNLTLSFSRDYFEGKEDVSGFSIDFSPYGKNDTSEISTTEPVRIPAEYGKTYTILFSGDRASGFQGILQPSN